MPWCEETWLKWCTAEMRHFLAYPAPPHIQQGRQDLCRLVRILRQAGPQPACLIEIKLAQLAVGLQDLSTEWPAQHEGAGVT